MPYLCLPETRNSSRLFAVSLSRSPTDRIKWRWLNTAREKRLWTCSVARDHAYAQNASLAGTEKAHDKNTQHTATPMVKLILTHATINEAYEDADPRS